MNRKYKIKMYIVDDGNKKSFERVPIKCQAWLNELSCKDDNVIGHVAKNLTS